MLVIAIRFALYANLMVLFGWPLFALYGTPGGTDGPSPRCLALLAMAAAGLSIASIVAMTASMSGVTIVDVDRDSIAAMVFETPMGLAWQARMAALAVLLALTLTCGRPARTGRAILAAVALASLAWTGHGAAGEAAIGWFQLAADIVHLLAAGAWVGALVALGSMLIRDASRLTSVDFVMTHRALAGFSNAGGVIVALLIITGLANSWILVGPRGVAVLLSSEYGRLLAIKLALFVAMLGLAAMNRFRLTPALAQTIDAGAMPYAALSALRRSIAAEIALVVAVLAVVAWLGTLAPPSAL